MILPLFYRDMDSLETEILGQNMSLVGRIIWYEEKYMDVYQYGVEFVIDEDERNSIAKVLNLFSMKLRKESILPDCRFIDTDARMFFGNHK